MIFSKRPRRHTREYVQHFLRCPLCWGDGERQGQLPNPEKLKHPQPLRVVAYRSLGVRLECPSCGLRFTVPVTGAGGLADVLRTSEIDLRSEASDQPLDHIDLTSIDFDDIDYPVRVRELIADELAEEARRARETLG